PNESALGKRIRIVGAFNDEQKLVWLRIIGVVKHTLYGDANNESAKLPTVFRPFGQLPRNNLTIAVEMKSDRENIVRRLRDTIASIDPELPIFQVEDYEDKVLRNGAPIRFISSIFMIFGVAAAILAG